MASYIVATDLISTTGNGFVLADYFDYLFVGRNATLGSTFLSGRGVVMQDASQRLDVAGAVIGLTGVEVLGSGADITVSDSGIISARGTAISLADYGVVVNAGQISGLRGIYAEGALTVTNAGTISGGIDAVFVLGNATIRNTGTISSNGTAVFVDGVAHISNFGTILGGITSNGANGTVLNRGVITGGVSFGVGNDLVDNAGGRIESEIYLGAGNDRFIGGAGNDTVRGHSGDDDLNGGAGDDKFFAGAGSDMIDGGTGMDAYDARSLTVGVLVNLATGIARSAGISDELTGIERAYGGTGADRIYGDGMINSLRGEAGDDLLSGLAGADLLDGGVGRDTLAGGDGNDTLRGAEGVDALVGGAGNDLIWGSYDSDRMTGDSGADRFDFNDFDEFLPVVGSSKDLITDFVHGVDVIDFSSIDARGTIAGDQAFKFEGTAGINALGEISYRYVANMTVISMGLNAPAAFDVLVLNGRIALTAADFVL